MFNHLHATGEKPIALCYSSQCIRSGNYFKIFHTYVVLYVSCVKNCFLINVKVTEARQCYRLLGRTPILIYNQK